MSKQSKPLKQSPNATTKKKLSIGADNSQSNCKSPSKENSIGTETSPNGTAVNNETPISPSNETNSSNSKTDRSGNDPSLSTSKNPATTAKEKQGTRDKKSIRFNVAHILFLHGLLKTFYNMPDLDKKMSEFVHDLTLLFEIYLEDCEVPEELAKHFNYSPLKED